MTWLDDLEARGGPLVGPAGRLLCDAPGALGTTFRGGSAGILALARSVERYCERDDGSDEASFVEAAGALLGLILIDHLGRARHVARDGQHRLQLGHHGFFDPFRAIESALDADDIRRHLAREVARAEAEARGEGPLSAFVRSFAACLAELRPDVHVVDQFETRLYLSDGSEVDVARSVRATLEESERARRAAARRIVEMLPRGGAVRAAFTQVAPRLLPRLCQRGAFDDLSAQGRGRIFTRPWLGPLSVALVVEDEGRCRYARQDEVDGWCQEGGEPVQRALRNLAARSDAARFARLDTEHGPLVIGKSGDGLDSARALLPGLFEVLQPELGERMQLAIPHRDLLLASPAQPRALVHALGERARRDCARAPHPLSHELLLLDRHGVREASRG